MAPLSKRCRHSSQPELTWMIQAQYMRCDEYDFQQEQSLQQLVFCSLALQAPSSRQQWIGKLFSGWLDSRELSWSFRCVNWGDLAGNFPWMQRDKAYECKCLSNAMENWPVNPTELFCSQPRIRSFGKLCQVNRLAVPEWSTFWKAWESRVFVPLLPLQFPRLPLS